MAYSPPPAEYATATCIELDVPYANQRDNEGNAVVYGDQMCNVTSLGMCASYYGATPDAPFTQIEDQISDHLNSLGLSHYEPYDLQQGYNTLFTRSVDVFVPDAKIDDIVQAIRGGFPCVIHGYFTKGGHIVTVVGFDLNEKELIINDPYGNWYSSWYDKNSIEFNDNKGERVRFKFSTIDSLCNDNGIWTHIIKPQE